MAVIVDSVSNATATNTSPITWAHTLGGGSNLVLVVAISAASATLRTVSSVTYGVQGLARVTSSRVVEGNNVGFSELWYIVAPSGNQTITVTLSGAAEAYCGAVVFRNAHQTVTLGTAATNTGTTSPGSVTVTSGTTDGAIGNIVYPAASVITIAETAGTQRWSTSMGAGTSGGCGSTIVGSASAAFSFTITDSGGIQPWAASGVSVKPSVGGGATTMTADVQTFSWTGNAAPLTEQRILIGTLATFSMSGADTLLGISKLLAPTSDISTNSWTSTGANLFSVLDELTPDDADYIISPVNPTGQIAEVKFAPGTDPVMSTGHGVRYRIAAISADAQITVALYCGATSIASWTQTLIADAGGTTYENTLTGGQADAITDYTDLRLRFSATA